MRDLDAAFGDTDTIVNVTPFQEADDPEQRFYANIRQLFKEGKSIDEILEITGLSERKIYDITQDLRVSKTAQKRQHVYQWHDDGIDVNTIAERIGKSVPTIYRWLKKRE